MTLAAPISGLTVDLLSVDGIIDGNPEASNIVAETLIAIASTGIGFFFNPIETEVAILNAITTTGGIFILEADAIILNNVFTGTENVVISNIVGNMMTCYVEATTGGVYLTAIAGSILDGTDGPGLDIKGGADSVLWAGEHIGQSFPHDPIEVEIIGRLNVSAWGLDRSDLVSIIINGVVLPTNTLDVFNTPPGLVIFNNRILGGGNIEELFRAVTGDLAQRIYEFTYYLDILLHPVTDEMLEEPLDEIDVEAEMLRRRK